MVGDVRRQRATAAKSSEASVVIAAGSMGSIGIMGERPGCVLLKSLIHRRSIREHDLDPGSPEPILHWKPHASGDHDVTVADRIHQIVMATAMPRIRVISLVTRADLPYLALDLDAVFEVDDDERLGTAEVSGDGLPVQSGKCNSHGLQDTGVSRSLCRSFNSISSADGVDSKQERV